MGAAFYSQQNVVASNRLLHFTKVVQSASAGSRTVGAATIAIEDPSDIHETTTGMDR